MADHSSRNFAVVPPQMLAGGLLGLALLVPAVAIVLALVFPGQREPLGMVRATIGLAALAVALLSCFVGLTRRRVELSGDSLRVVAGLFSKTVAVAAIDLAQARVVDLAERTELRPSIKTFGMSLPGYKAGHFHLRKGHGRAFCLLTQERGVLWLPLCGGKDQLLLSLERPQALLDTLGATPR